MIDLDTETICRLPVDSLGLIILADLLSSNEWNEDNYMLQVQRSYRHPEGVEAIAEAFGWLRARSLIARSPTQSATGAIFVTRTGKRVVSDGPSSYYAAERLQGGSHALVEREARSQFLIGKYELGVFASMKAVEIRVRSLGGFTSEHYGVPLMNLAFGSTGPLTDPSAPKAEQEGMRFLFAGAYAVLRNPSGHREVNYDDVAEAAEAVQTASLLMRMLDRIEARIR